MKQRFFHVDPDTYEATRLALDARLGFGPGRGTLTSISPVVSARRNADGRVVVAAWERLLDNPAVMTLLPGLLANGQAVEITRDEYDAAMPKGTP